MRPRPRTVLLIALIFAAAHRHTDSLCLEVKLKTFINRYNTVQEGFGYPSCCEGNKDTYPFNLRHACLDCNPCDHAFRVELSSETNGDVVDSGWSGTESYSPVSFGDKIGHLTNQFKHCKKMDKDRPDRVKVIVHVMDEDDWPDADDVVTKFEVIIDPHKIIREPYTFGGVEHSRIVAWSKWMRENTIANQEHEAPYYLEFEAKFILEDRDPQRSHFFEFSPRGNTCSSNNTLHYNCRAMQFGEEWRSIAPAPAGPPAASLALLLLAARALAL